MKEYKVDPKDKWTLISIYVVIMIVLIIATGCTQIKYVPVKEYITKDSIVTKVVHDSIDVKVKEYVKGDTIRYDSIVYKYQFLHDTVTISKNDSIPYPVEVVKEVERKRNGYEKTMIRLGWCFIGFILAFIGWKGINYYLRIKSR